MPVLALALALWQCAVPSRGAALQRAPSFPASVEMVKVTTLVSGGHGRPLTGLRREDFQVWADGRRQEIAYFGAPTDAQAFDVALAVDTSGSMAAAHEQVALAAVRFLYEVPSARLRLLASFDNDVRFWRTGAPTAEVVKQMNEAAAPRGATALRSAVHAVLRRFAGADRAALVVLTDGEEQGSIVGPGELRAAIQSSNVTIYPVRYATAGPLGGSWFARQTLAAMARESGGRVFEGHGRDAAGVFQQISAELGAQYVLGFVPLDRSPGVHPLQVKVRAGHVHHRAGYLIGGDR